MGDQNKRVLRAKIARRELLLGVQIESLAPTRIGSTNWDAARRFLMVSLQNRVSLVNPPPETIDEREVRRLSREGFTIVHSQIGQRLRGEAIPVVRLIPTRSTGRLTVIAHSRGKAALATTTGQPSETARALLAAGQSVLGFDPLFVGESIDPARPVTHCPDTAHFETYNPSLAADQMQDLATVLSWARSQADVREVSLVGQGLAGPKLCSPGRYSKAWPERLWTCPAGKTPMARGRSPLPLTCRAFSSSAVSRPPPPFLLQPQSGFTVPDRHLNEPGPRAPMNLLDPLTHCGSRPARSRPRPSCGGSTGASET